MSEPIWVRDDIVRAIHRRQLAEHGGAEGIRDEGLLVSALARPRAALAAAYSFGLAKNHPFVDGNKRTAFVVCLTFLELNGYRLSATHEDRYRTFLQLAEGQLSEDDLATWIRLHSSAVA